MAGLGRYHAKRRFDVTAEPRGKVERRKGSAFVIQKHAATRLHYDLRLELDGVMKSWAVTRGPSLVPGEKRLAVEVEDHPIEYNKFEGTIPKGEYGGGTVMIWDRGQWLPEADPHRGLEKGHLNFTLDGKKLHGAWHLVRMHRRPGEKRNNWLLIKSDDEAARTARDTDILEEEPNSAASGRTMDDIANRKKGAVWHSNRSAKENAARLKREKRSKPAKNARARQPKSKRKVSTRKERRPARPAKRKRRPNFAGPAAGSRARPMPAFVPPCLATLSEKAPSSANWVHEIKFDGYRIQARLSHGKVSLKTRQGLNWTEKFRTTAEAVAELPADEALLDGEVVALDQHGISSFSLLQQELKAGHDEALIYYVFDLLYLNGRDLTGSPLSERRRLLAALFEGVPKEGAARWSESFEEDGPVLHKHACGMGLEGIVSKRDDAPYRSGRGNDWLKTKCADRQEFVVLGYKPSSADQYTLGAFALGYYENGKLQYAGRCGTGFTHKMARDLYKQLQPLRQKETPLDRVPDEERGKNGVLWVRPQMVVEAEFHGWTHSNHIRQASFQGVREDKPPEQVRREVKTMPTSRKIAASIATRKIANSANSKVKSKEKRDDKADREEFAGVRLTHPDRVYWDDVDVTKRALAEYYSEVWEFMRPHVTGRVIALLRCPQGAGDGRECFFQKHASGGLEAKHLVSVPDDGDKVIAVDDLSGIIALVQAGVLEIHVRGSTIDRLGDANRLVFDLDPGPGVPWKDMIAAAREVRDRLAEFKLESFIKVTGGKGLHVVLPIRPAAWEEVKTFCHGIAAEMSADSPTRFVDVSTKSKRDNRIFVDYLRNSREATAIAPYSTRARAGATVAVPIDWHELTPKLSPNQFNVMNTPQRIARLRKDPWATMGKIKQSLPKLRR